MVRAAATQWAVIPMVLAAQATPSEVSQERADFISWLAAAPTSPLRAMVLHPIGPGIRLGPATAEIPLRGVDARVEQRGLSLSLIVAGSPRPLPRDRAVPLGGYQIVAAGRPSQAVLTVFGRDAVAGSHEPSYYPYVNGWQRDVVLTPIDRPQAEPMLAPDGTEVEATEAGTVTISIAGQNASLRVFRIPTAGGEESELEVFFRDGTNGKETYPAGRFVSLLPLGGNRFRLDFNRARNPFCAYNTVYPCPAPWRGNRLTAAVVAGEQYRAPGTTQEH